MQPHHHSRGFSLLEITISIAIIALLMAAVATTSNIKDKADYNTMVDNLNSIAAGVESFQNTYGGLPGDIYNATNYFGTVVDNGNGNNIIDSVNTFGDESRDFWEHLSRASLISGSYDGGTSNEPGVGVMEAPFKNGGYFAATTTSPTSPSDATLAIIVGKFHTGTFTAPSHPQGLLQPSVVEKYDLTYDDGNASTGNVIATEGSDFSAGDCQTGGTYNSTNDDKSCIFHVIIVQ